MQVTDEMVEKARHVLRQRPNDVHGALEAALGARKTKGEFVSHLLNWADVKEASCASYSTAIAREAAACIEDLAAALRPLGVFGDDEQGWRAATLAGRERARAALERWGLK